MRIAAQLLVMVLVLSACVRSDTQPLVDEVGALRDDVASLREQVTELESNLTATTAPSNQVPSTTTTVAEATTTSTVSAPPTTSPSVDIGGLAVAFFVASETLCLTHSNLTGNPPPDHTRYENVEVVEILDDDRVEIRDGLGYHLIVDFASEPATIYASEGPEDILPHDLSFGCPPELYPGTLPS